jgi:hypothetical protein
VALLEATNQVLRETPIQNGAVTAAMIGQQAMIVDTSASHSAVTSVMAARAADSSMIALRSA